MRARRPGVRSECVSSSVLVLRHYSIRYGIDISRDARIGSGLYIGHFGGIFVSGGVIIGDNCNISQGVTLGQQNRGERTGCPVIGNNVYIAPGAKIIGRVKIGDLCGGRSQRGRGKRRRPAY